LAVTAIRVVFVDDGGVLTAKTPERDCRDGPHYGAAVLADSRRSADKARTRFLR